MQLNMAIDNSKKIKGKSSIDLSTGEVEDIESNIVENVESDQDEREEESPTEEDDDALFE